MSHRRLLLVIVLLLSGGCNLGPDHHPLQEAALRGDSGEVRRLLAEGADPEKGNGYSTPLMAAAQAGSLEVTDLVLKAGADPNKRTDDGSTALIFLALHTDNVAVAERLLLAGADPCVVPDRGPESRRAAAEALEAGHESLARFLATKSAGC